MLETTFNATVDLLDQDFEMDVDVVVIGDVKEEWHPDPESQQKLLYAKVDRIYVFLQDTDVTEKVTESSMRHLRQLAEEELCRIAE